MRTRAYNKPSRVTPRKVIFKGRLAIGDKILLENAEEAAGLQRLGGIEFQTLEFAEVNL
jgi:hypothetical protein